MMFTFYSNLKYRNGITELASFKVKNLEHMSLLIHDNNRRGIRTLVLIKG